MFITVRLVFKIHVCNLVCLMLELYSYKPFGLLCSSLYSVLNELRCQMNKPRLKQDRANQLTGGIISRTTVKNDLAN